jgi:hypothetical protein
MLTSRSIIPTPGQERPAFTPSLERLNPTPIRQSVPAIPDLERAIADLKGPDARQLRRLLGDGLAAMTQHPLRSYAAELLAAARTAEPMSPGIAHLLSRLSTAGIMPTYDEYIAVAPLAAHLTTSDPDVLLRSACRTVAELVIDLMSCPQLESLPTRPKWIRSLHQVLDVCNDIHHGPNPPIGPSPDVVAYTSLTQSNVLTERVFQRTTQCQEVIFAACANLLTTAADDIAYGAVTSATHRLHNAAVLMDKLLPKTFRILEPLTLQDWLRFRPLIEKPSAIQAVNYRTLAAKLQSLHVNFAPHRFRPWELELAQMYQKMLAVVCKAHVRWQAQHIAIVAKYTPETRSQGLNWLLHRVEALRRECKPHRVKVVRKHLPKGHRPTEDR